MLAVEKRTGIVVAYGKLEPSEYGENVVVLNLDICSLTRNFF
jgi:hypothetical protein